MTRLVTAALLSLALAAPAGAAPYALVDGPSGVVKAPLFSKKYQDLVVARVDGRPVTLRELSDALAATHSSHGKGKKAGKKDFTPVLERLIGAQLVVRDAHEMGLDELPEIKDQIAKFEKTALREEVKARALKDVKPPPAEVASLYKRARQEWKVRSVLFAAEADAQALALAAAEGRPFAELAREAIAAKKAEGQDTAEWLAASANMHPAVREALFGLQQGQASKPIRVDKGFTVVAVEAARTGKENPEALAEIKSFVLKNEKEKVLQQYFADLAKKHAHIDDKLLASIDFEAADPGPAKLAEDTRVLARIDGQPDVLVKDLAAEIGAAFFHGTENAAKEKRVHEKQKAIWENLLAKRMVELEAKRLGLADGPEVRRRLAEFRDSLLFAACIERAVKPDVSVKEEELQAYYEEHKADYSYPAFYTLHTLSFATKAQAQAAVQKLQAGTDFKWLKANADGQLPSAKRAVDLDGGVTSINALPPDLVKALAGAKGGEVRLYSSGGQHYAVQVARYIPPQAQPYQEVREKIGPKVGEKKLQKALDDYVARLRKAYQVKVFITRIAS